MREAGDVPSRKGVESATHRTDPTVQAAVADAFEQYATLIYRFAYRRLGNRESAQDVTAQVFLKAARGLDPSFGDEARRAWLFRAARTAIVDVWRSYGECPVVPLDWYADEPSPTATSDSTAVVRVSRILVMLNPMQRRVLELRFLEGKSLLETADELGITEGNVKVLQHRALRRAAELNAEERDG
jgi:RNA polymerase sigma-70 factor (ECF subfamily)